MVPMTSFITKNRLIIFSLTASAFLAFGSWVIQSKIESDSKMEIGRYLRAELNMTHQAVRSWVKVQRASSLAWADMRKAHQFAETLLAYRASKETLLDMKVQVEVGRWLAPAISSNKYEDFFIIGPDNINLSASDREDIGVISALLKQPELLKRVWGGSSLVTLPQQSVQSPSNMGGNVKTDRAEMFAASPIRNELGEVIAILAFRINPSLGFSTIFKRAWGGVTGEVYAFDDEGRLISESRFDQQLREAGLIGFNQKAMLNITLRSYSKGIKTDSKKALLTLMVQQAISGHAGMNLEGYSNYYGAKNVVGVWLWDEQLGFGFAAEMEKAELFQSIYSNRVAITSATLFSIIFFLALMVVFIRHRTQILEREIHQRAVLDTIAEGIITTTPSGIIETVNPAIELIFGYQVSELVGKHINMLVPACYGKLQVKQVPAFDGMAAEENNAVVNMRQETVGLYRAGVSFPLEITVCEMHIDEQRKYNCTLRDITESKQAELTLREREKQFRKILDCSPLPMMVTDMSGNIELFNQKFVELFGWTIEEIATLNQWWEAVYPEDIYRNDIVSEWEQIVKKANTDGTEIPPQEWMLTCKNGDARMVEFRMMPAGSEHNVIVISDITERIRAETVLIDARKQAELATKAKSEFLAVMSHEIRTPMNGVLGMAQLLQKSVLNEEQRGQVDILYQSGKSLLNIINDILDFSKVEAGKSELELSEFDLEQALSHICHLLSTKADEKGLELILNYSHECPRYIVADAGRIRQVMLNLIGNAIKFTEKGHVVVRVRREGRADDLVDLLLEVQDTGIGIDMGGEMNVEGESKLFLPFSQADASTTRRFGGTGLGLAISKQLVKLMDGEIGVNSAPGLGSTFWLRLKLPLAEQQKTLQNKQPLADISVLLISKTLDDSKDRCRQLETLAMHVEVVAGLEEGEQRLRDAEERAHPFTVALLDCDATNTDCDTFVQSIKRGKTLAKTLLILLGHKEAHPEKEYLTCFPKPTSIEALQQLLVETLIAANELPPQSIVNSDDGAQQLFDSKYLPNDVRLLLVEDNLVNQKVASEILQKLNFNVDIVSNGVEALSRYKSVKYDLILMDCLMPKMDGYLATQKIREMEQGRARHVPIIALTADALRGNEQRCFDAGMDDYLSKPFNISELQNKLIGWLGSSEMMVGSGEEYLQPAIDKSATAELRRALGSDFIEVVDAFFESMPSLFAAMYEATHPYDTEVMICHAHSMKSCSANVGAMHLSELAFQLEKEIKHSDAIDFDMRFSQLRQAFELAKMELEKEYK